MAAKVEIARVKLDRMYAEWLSGDSIRVIARRYNLGRMTVYPRFISTYGEGCCSLRRQSLARVVMKEYGDLDLAERARGVPGLYRSVQTENHYSKLQTTDLEDYNLTYCDREDEERGLSLSLIIWTLDLTKSILSGSISSPAPNEPETNQRANP